MSHSAVSGKRYRNSGKEAYKREGVLTAKAVREKESLQMKTKPPRSLAFCQASHIIISMFIVFVELIMHQHALFCT